jgi:hypothetical protein
MATRPRKPKALLNPKQVTFLSAYLNPASETHGNALQSALKAGYSQNYAESIVAQGADWLKESLGDTKHDKMLAKAEKNLHEFLELDPNIEMTRKDGGTYTKFSSEVLKVKADVTKFVAERVGRERYGSKDPSTAPTPTVINYNLFYKPEFQQTLRNAESEMKRVIENAQPIEENPEGN